MQAIFLDWQAPYLVTVVDYLYKTYLSNNSCNLEDVLVVTPTKRINRRLLELLTLKVDEDSVVLVPPRFSLSETFLSLVTANPASSISNEVKIALWTNVIFNAPNRSNSKFIPENISYKKALNLASTIFEAHAELSEENLTFLDVAKKCQELHLDIDESIYFELEEYALKYQEKLDQNIINNQKTFEDKEIVPDIILVGSFYHTKNKRNFFELYKGVIKNLIPAPVELKDHFDEYGAIVPKKWLNRDNNIKEDSIHFVNDNIEEAYKIKEFIETENIADLTILNLNNEFLNDLLEKSKIPLYKSEGLNFFKSNIGSFFKLFLNFIRSQKFKDFSTLLKHPNISEIILKEFSFDTSKIMDEFYQKHLPLFFDFSSDFFNEKLINKIKDFFASDFISFMKNDLTPESIDQFINFFSKLFDESKNDVTEYEANSTLMNLILNTNQIFINEKSTFIDYLEYLEMTLENKSIQYSNTGSEIPVFGWLDGILDDADSLVIANFIDTKFPEKNRSSPFLPKNIRVYLGLMEDSFLVARDNFLISQNSHARKKLALFIPSKDFNDDQNLPSKLIYNCEDEILIKRIDKFFNFKEVIDSPKSILLDNIGLFKAPLPETNLPAITTVPITTLKDYALCKYRFYLKNINKLKSLDDKLFELAPYQIGNLFHKAAEQYIKILNEKSSNQSLNLLYEIFEDLFIKSFGTNHLYVLNFQSQIIKIYLESFYHWNAEFIKAGYENILTEQEIVLDLFQYNIDIKLTGRIDRIDYNAKENQLVIIDYKTKNNDNIESDYKVQDRWIDFQLPLYYKYILENLNKDIFKRFSLDTQIKVANLYISNNQNQSQSPILSVANWQDSDFEEAFSCALGFVKDILKNDFYPPNIDYKNNYDNFPFL